MKAIIPVKRFALAKQRLSPFVSAQLRARLAQAMAEHVLTELASSHMLTDVLVVSAEPAIARFAARLGFSVYADQEVGLNPALADALLASNSDAGDIAIVHADLPLFIAVEFDRLAKIHCSGAPCQLSLVPDLNRNGTNILFSRPGVVVPMRFGERSAHAHLTEAHVRGIAASLLDSDMLALDCDDVTDIGLILDRAAGRTSPALDLLTEAQHEINAPIEVAS